MNERTSFLVFFRASCVKLLAKDALVVIEQLHFMIAFPVTSLLVCSNA
jgi:hypothetical protein